MASSKGRIGGSPISGPSFILQAVCADVAALLHQLTEKGVQYSVRLDSGV